MKKVSALLLILMLLTLSGYSQKKEMRVIKATSKMVDIRDGEEFYKGNWTIVPDAKPDVYSTKPEQKTITFYTDIDSISFDVKPGEIYDFIILLNEKDSAWTQIDFLPDYLGRLKNAKEYNYSDQRPIATWHYMTSSNPDLKKLREEYKLDSIAGDGDEMSKILNLMYWLHDLIRHDGSSYNPSPQNARAIIKICKEENRGVNCRMLATVLNECYLAIGIKSRFVTCMPKEAKFSDCHVINAVYSKELDKWVWIDPSFAAYVKDEKDNFLGIQEVRERLTDGRPLVLNEDANWNHISKQTKEYYLDYYMAKNLYRLECPATSRYDTETWLDKKESVYVELLPLDGLEQSPQKNVSKNGDRIWVNYKTNNPSLFWEKPE